MIVMRSATLGFALALGAAGAHAQSVVTRHVDNELVETTVARTPTGTVITRRPLDAAPARTISVDETVGAAPHTRTRTTTRTTHRVVHHARRTTTERSVTHTVRTTHRAARPLALAPAQRQVIYRTLVQQQVIPAVPAQVVGPPSVPGYPPFPPPAYPVPAVVAEPATTGYAVSTPAEVVDEDDYPAAPAAAAQVYPVGQIYPVGSVLPARVAVAPLPASATVAVPAARPYSYATVDGRVLLVDPVSNSVVADITP
jgi:hypothetical protein